MKKIAFFVQHMLCGGVENALIALSKKLTEAGNDVTIYVITKKGDFMSRIPACVHQKKIPMPKQIEDAIPVGGTKISIRNNLKEHHYFLAAQNLIRHMSNRSGFAELNVDFGKIPMLNETYDIAVNYHMHSPFLVRYVAEKVNAKHKLSWIHNDFSMTGYNIKALKPYLECYEGFYGVSQKIVDEFFEIFPEYGEKTHVALNLVPVDEILQKADAEELAEYASVPEGYLKVLSVGRLEAQKGYDITVEACKKLVEKGDKFKWFILGEGTERNRLKSEIKRLGLEDTIYLLGVRMNPYPYFKNCDIYIQTSRHEGYVTTVTEAKIFNRPIVCTDVSGAREQLRDGVTGDITEIDMDSVVKKADRLIRDEQRRRAYSQALTRENKTENAEWLRVFEG